MLTFEGQQFKGTASINEKLTVSRTKSFITKPSINT